MNLPSATIHSDFHYKQKQIWGTTVSCWWAVWPIFVRALSRYMMLRDVIRMKTCSTGFLLINFVYKFVAVCEFFVNICMAMDSLKTAFCMENLPRFINCIRWWSVFSYCINVFVEQWQASLMSHMRHYSQDASLNPSLTSWMFYPW